MDESMLDQIGKESAEIAMQAAAQYIRTHKLVVRDYEAAIECLRSHVRASMPKIMDETKAALDCGMEAVAAQTFRAGLALVGIEAAKEFCQ